MLNVRALLTPAPASERALIKADAVARSELRDARTAQAELEIESGERTREKRPAWLLIVTLLVVVAALAAVAGGIQYTRSDDGYSDSDYLRAAADRVQVLLTPDGGDDGRRSAQILAGATGEFEDEFAQSVDAYTEFVAQIGAVATGTVDGVGVSSRSGDQVTLVVTAAIAVRSDLTTASSAAPTTRRFRLQVQMVPDGGSLKISALEFFG